MEDYKHSLRAKGKHVCNACRRRLEEVIIMLCTRHQTAMASSTTPELTLEEDMVVSAVVRDEDARQCLLSQQVLRQFNWKLYLPRARATSVVCPQEEEDFDDDGKLAVQAFLLTIVPQNPAYNWAVTLLGAWDLSVTALADIILFTKSRSTCACPLPPPPERADTTMPYGGPARLRFSEDEWMWSTRSYTSVLFPMSSLELQTETTTKMLKFQ
jgi:hypothetical protein